MQMAFPPTLEKVPVEVADLCLRYDLWKIILKRRITLKNDEMVTLRGMWEQKLKEQQTHTSYYVPNTRAYTTG